MRLKELKNFGPNLGSVSSLIKGRLAGPDPKENPVRPGVALAMGKPGNDESQEVCGHPQRLGKLKNDIGSSVRHSS